MKLIRLFVLLVAAAVVAPVVASTPTGVPRPWDSDEGSSTVLTVTVKATIAEVGDDATIVLEQEGTGGRATIQITDGIALRADRKKDFGGRRRLAVADLAAGQRVKVTLRKEDGQVLEIRVLELAAA